MPTRCLHGAYTSTGALTAAGYDARMHSTPATLGQPCWHCRFFVAMAYQGTAARCSQPGGPVVRSQPQHGCSSYQREPGTDDEPGPPVMTVRAVSRVGAVAVAAVPVDWAP